MEKGWCLIPPEGISGWSAHHTVPRQLPTLLHKQALRDGETNPYPTCKHSLVSVESDVVNSRLMLERRYAHVMETFLVWLVF